jgi:PAS domain S-box-containing protein
MCAYPDLKQKLPDQANEKEAPVDLLHQKAFDNSLQPNIIFIVANGKIIKANKAACKLLGYSKKDLLTRYRKDIFSISESSYKKMMRERKLQGSAKADLSMVRKSGKLLPCEITSVIFKDDNGVNNSILSIVDLSERLIKQKKIDDEKEKVVADNIVIAQSKSDVRLLENNDWIKSVAKTTYDVIWDWDIATGQISFGNNFNKVFGYKLLNNRISFKEWMDLYGPKERINIKKKINKVFTSVKKSWQITYQYTCPGESMCEVILRANILRDHAGKVIRVIGVIHDISKIQKLEKTLDQEIRIKEKQIIEAIVEAREVERSDLGKELHDNINQLLAASILYLDMAREDIKDADIYLIHSLEYIRAAIEEIRKLSQGLTTDILEDGGLNESIYRMSRDTMQTYPVQIHCILDESLIDTLTPKFKLNLFRILQEQLNNIIKHAKASEIYIKLSQTDTGPTLSISDDGKGFDTTKKAKGIGISNIISRAKLYEGHASFISAQGKGCKLVVNFPIASAN